MATHVAPTQLLDDEWCRMFVRWCYRRRPFWDRADAVIETDKLASEAMLFTAQWNKRVKKPSMPELSTKILFGLMLRKQYIIPIGSDSFAFDKDKIRGFVK